MSTILNHLKVTVLLKVMTAMKVIDLELLCNNSVTVCNDFATYLNTF